MNGLRTNRLVTKALRIAEMRLGIDVLAEKLNASVGEIIAWRMGHAVMPERKWLKLVDILLDLDPEWITR